MNILNSLEDFDNAARIAGLRSLIHSAYTRGIGALRAHLNQQARLTRDQVMDTEADNGGISLDVRNAIDELDRSPNDAPVGLEAYPDPLVQAKTLAQVADIAIQELETLSPGVYDRPMDFDAMLKYMTDRKRPADEALIQAVAAHLKSDPAMVRKLVDHSNEVERLRLLNQAPDITSLWHNLAGGFGHRSSFDDLDLQTRLSLTVKTINGIRKSSDNALARIFRTKRMQDLSTCTVLNQAADQLTVELAEFEKRNATEIGVLIEAGRNIPELTQG